MAFVESKHRRVGGRFASKIGALSSTDRRGRLKKKAAQKKKLLGNGLQKNERPAKLKTKLGKRLVTKLEKNSQSRASKRRKGKRTRR